MSESQNTEQNRLSFTEKTKNFANFSWDLLSYVAKNGLEKVSVSGQVYNERYAICKGCEKYIQKHKECELCGCDVTMKARIIFDSCPLGKWSADRESWETKLEELSEEIDNQEE